MREARALVALEDCETVYVSSQGQTSTLQVAKSVVAEMAWSRGVDNTPWGQPCLVCREGDTVYYRYQSGGQDE